MVTRRTSRRKPVRTSRRLRRNARPIHVDDALVDKLMKQIVADLRKFKRRAAAEIRTRADLWSRSGFAFGKRQVVDIPDVTGENVKISISLRVPNRRHLSTFGEFISKKKLMQNIDDVSSGRKYQDIADELLLYYTIQLIPFDQDGSDATIDLYVRPLIDEDPEVLNWRNFFDKPFAEQEPAVLYWDMIDRANSVADIRETLKHEILHARDPELGGRPFKAKAVPGHASLSDEERRRWGQSSYYYNKPSELRAHMSAIYNEIVPGLKKKIERAQRSRPGQLRREYVMNLFNSALDLSKEWNAMERFLGDKSRKLILKGLVTALEDEGIITIE